ncbi:MAG: CocE/NonD family hydrolase C-terminal non-catalytic domain-containing protein, partial [Absicoccus porci]|uniref:CocE/NonD family hydrolase C-terminal non-catalytic domain-containing protein n=1 Tax=Absicoccus porci TaxID=2486576 RepID=UPI002E79F5FC
SQKQLQEQEDRESANYNRFWDERNYLKHVDNIQASIFVIQGLNDWNVKPDQGIRLFEAMQAQGKECMMLLHRGQHIYTYHLEGAPTLRLIDAWLDHYLKGIDNGIEKGPRIYVENNLDQKRWDTYRSWPPVPNQSFILHHPEETFIDDLSLSVYDRKEKNTQAWLDQLVKEKNAFSYRLDLQSIENESLFSGRAKIRFRAKINQPTAILSAMLVDVGKQCRLLDTLDGDENVQFTFQQESEPSDYFVISRAWMNAQNRTCNYRKEAIDPNTFYPYAMEFVSNDYRIEAHHTLVLILYGMDVDQTQLPYTKTQITIEKDSIELFLPIKATD